MSKGINSVIHKPRQTCYNNGRRDNGRRFTSILRLILRGETSGFHGAEDPCRGFLGSDAV